MRKTIIPMFLLVLLNLSITAQKINILSNEQVLLPTSEMGYFPIMSPNSDFILITSGDFKGIAKYDLNTKQFNMLSQEQGAGFGYQISNDGKHVVYRSQEYINRLRYMNLKSLDLTTGKETEIIQRTRNLEGFTVKEGTVLAVDNGKTISKQLSGQHIDASTAVASIRQGQLKVTRNNQLTTSSPQGEDLGYLWASVSPDGTKLLYYVIEHGKAYVSNIDGSNPVSLGVLRAPKWVGNEWVAGMVDFDNGHVVTSSKIVMVGANGKIRTDLTSPDVIALNPSGSADASKIVYNTADGKVFLMNIEILK